MNVNLKLFPKILLFFSLSFNSVYATDTLNLDFAQAIKLAMRKSPLRIEASADRFKSIVDLGYGIEGILPSATAYLSKTTPTSYPTSQLWNCDFTLQQAIFEPSVLISLINSFIGPSYYSLEEKDKLAQLLYNVTTDYLNLVKAQLLYEATKKTLLQAEEEKRLITEQFRLGQISQIDLLRGEVFYSQTQLNLLNAEKNLITAQESFKSTVGISQPVFIRATEQINQPAEWPIADPDTLLLLVEYSNLDIKRAKSVYVTQRLNFFSSLLKLLPSISYFRSWSYSDTFFPSDYSHLKDKTTITHGIRLSFPLADLKTVILTIGEALFSSRRARANLTKFRLQVRAALINALISYKETKERCTQAKHNLELNKKLVDLAVAQHRLGALPLADLLEFQANLAQAEANYFMALCDTYIQVSHIGYLLGKILPEVNNP